MELKEQVVTKSNDKLAIGLRQINASCPKDISRETLIACVKGKECPKQWRAHMVSFLEELPVELIHDMVLSGVFTFQELNDAFNKWECTDGPTTLWIKEMADLVLETAS